MQYSIANVFLQTVLVLGPSSESNVSAIQNPLYPNDAGHYLYTNQLDSSVPAVAEDLSRTEWRILSKSFSSVPVIWQTELDQEYQELGDALSEMTELDAADECRIEAPVYETARQVAAELMANSYPAPRVFSHGPKSIVFNWTHKTNNLYLTISADKISALISSPERIKRRIDYSAEGLLNPAAVLLSIESARSNQPVVLSPKLTSDPSELIG